jgi:hypothetical protein
MVGPLSLCKISIIFHDSVATHDPAIAAEQTPLLEKYQLEMLLNVSNFDVLITVILV